jgi:hypothetical protein
VHRSRATAAAGARRRRRRVSSRYRARTTSSAVSHVKRCIAAPDRSRASRDFRDFPFPAGRQQTPVFP